MPTKTLSVDLPRIDADTQSRLAINEDVVQDYADLIAESNGEWPYPPLDVFHDGSEYFVADGFHRFLAAHRAKRASIPCRIHKGTAKDARIFGMTANDKHGLRMSRADKRACVEWLLDNGGKMTQTEIAAVAGVSRRTVAQVVADRKPKIVQTSQPSGGGGSVQRAAPPPPSGKPVRPTPPAKPIKSGNEAEHQAFVAKQQIKVWHETIARWLGGELSIDNIRNQYPGPEGDRVVELATEFYEALKKWPKAIK
jgi:hypothetical protein